MVSEPTCEALQRTVCRPGLLHCVAVIGTVLNLINRDDALFAGQGLDAFEIGPAYCVPFQVAGYDAYSAMRATRREAAEGRLGRMLGDGHSQGFR